MTELRRTELTMLVTEVLRNAPEWVRRDLAARDPSVRARAEDTLAAMIAAALASDSSTRDQSVSHERAGAVLARART